MSGTYPYWLGNYYPVINGSTGPTGPAVPFRNQFQQLVNGTVTNVAPVFTQSFHGLRPGFGTAFYVNFLYRGGTWINGESYVVMSVIDTNGNTLASNSLTHLASVNRDYDVWMTVPFQATTSVVTLRIEAKNKTNVTVPPTVSFKVGNFIEA